MIDPHRVLRPLDDEIHATDTLTTYNTPDALAAALLASQRGVERTLRQLLRADADAPDDLRLSALSPEHLPYDRLVPALSRRNLISLRLAGMAHELEQTARRAQGGDVHAADADAALATVAALRAEVSALAGASSEVAPLREDAWFPQVGDDVQVRSGGPRALLLALSMLAVAVLVMILVLRRPDPLENAVAAFGAGRLDVAETELLRVLDEDADNVTALLYAGRIYRRQDRPREAADVLERAARLEPADAAVRRELGYLFLDLNRPQAAAQQFRLAQESEPENERNWIGLIRALREAGDPEAEQVVRQAPAGVRAALTSGLLPPDIN